MRTDVPAATIIASGRPADLAIEAKDDLPPPDIFKEIGNPLMRPAPFAILAFLALAASPAAAQERDQPRSPALTRLVDCRALAGAEERLACYDREVAELDAAEARKDVVVVDREQLRKTRRTLFGLTLPNLSIFGDDSPDQEGFQKIEAKIKSVSQTPYGKWIFELEDGARWVQTDSRELNVWPKPGHDIAIRRAAMGSYLANVNKQIAIRVRRER